MQTARSEAEHPWPHRTLRHPHTPFPGEFTASGCFNPSGLPARSPVLSEALTPFLLVAGSARLCAGPAAFILLVADGRWVAACWGCCGCVMDTPVLPFDERVGLPPGLYIGVGLWAHRHEGLSSSSSFPKCSRHTCPEDVPWLHLRYRCVISMVTALEVFQFAFSCG